MPLLTNYQRTITLFAYIFDQSACYYSFAHFSTNQYAITVILHYLQYKNTS